MSVINQSIQITSKGTDFLVQAPGYRLIFTGADAIGRVLDSSGREMAAVSFVPGINGQTLADFEIRNVRQDNLNLNLLCKGDREELSLYFAFLEQGFAYWYELPPRKGLSRFELGKVQGSFDIAHNFGPDLERFDIARHVPTQVQIGSRQAKYQKFFELDHGNYMIPPYLLGLGRNNQKQLVGVGVLDVSEAAFPFDAALTTEGITLQFDYGQAIQSGYFISPPAGIYFVNGRAELLGAYRKSISAYRKSIRRSEDPEIEPASWWSDPIYTTWGDQVYKKHLEEGNFTTEAGSAKYLTAELVDSALAKLYENDLHPKTIVLDEGWSTNLGDWEPADERFGGSLARFIEDKRRNGHNIVLYFSPFLVSCDSKVAAQHPEFLLKDQAGKPRTVKHSGTDFFLFDWSNPDIERFIGGLLQKIKALKVDGFKIAGIKYLPEPLDRMHSVSFPRGDFYLLNVLCSLSVQLHFPTPPGPAVFLACMNPAFEGLFHVIRLGNTSEVNHDIYVQRSATCAALMPGKIIDTDDWAAFQKVIGTSTFVKAVCGVPNIFSAFYRGEGRLRVQGAMGGCPVRIEPEQYRVLSVAWKLYEFSRGADRANLNVDFDRMEFSAGKMGDECFVRTYQGANILAVYRGQDIYLASLLDAKAIIDLPAGFEIEAVNRIGRNGGVENVPWSPCLEGKVIFPVQSSRDQTYYYHIKGVH